MRIKQLLHSRILAAVITATLINTAVVAAASPIAIDTRQNVGSAPATFRIRITVEPDIKNRYLCLVWSQVQGGRNERTSCQAIDALVKDDGTVVLPPKTHWQMLRDLPSGRWEVVAYVVRNDEQGRLSNRLTLKVLGPNYESEPEP